jgi:PAS domain S-box-containing protein
MAADDAEDELLRAVALQNARSILLARQRAEEELLRMKEALGKQSEWLRVTLASIGDAVVTADTGGSVLSLNAVAEQLTGWTQPEAQGRPLGEVIRIIDEASRQPADDPVRRALQEGRIVGLVNQAILVARDRSEIPIDDSVAPIRDEQGHVHGVVLVFRSVAARRQAEEALRESERELADFFDNASVGLHWVGPDGVIRRVNQAELDLLGYSREEYVGRPIADFHVDPDAIADILRRLSAGETLRDYEARMRCKDGTIRHVLLDSSVRREAGRFVHSRCFTRDITERKRAEQRLLAQHAVTRALAESATLDGAAARILRAVCERLGWQVGALWSVDRRARVVRCVDVYHLPSIQVPRFEAASRGRVFERGRGLPGRVWASGGTVWIPDVVRDENFPRAAIADAEGLHGAFAIPVMLDGEVLGVLEFFSHEIRQPDPDLVQLLTAMVSQIGQFMERRRAEAALRRWEHIFQQAGWAVAVEDPDDSTLEAVNPAFAAMHGYTLEELAGRPLADMLAPEARGELPRHVRAAHERGDHVYESIHLRRDGTRFPCLTHVTAVKDERGAVVFRAATLQDLTGIRAAEQAVRESEARFRQLADSMPQIVWAARPDGFVDYYNERWYEFTGFPREQYGDESWTPILHPDDVARCVDTYRGCIRTGHPYQIEHRFRDRRAGGFRWFLGRAIPVRDERGRIVRWFGTCTDIDDTKRTEETTRFLADASATLAQLTDPGSTLERIVSLAVPAFADWCAVDVLEPDGSLRRLASTRRDPARPLADGGERGSAAWTSDARGALRVLRSGEADWAADVAGAALAGAAGDDELHLRRLREAGVTSYISVPLASGVRTLGVLTFVTAASGRVYGVEDVRAARDLAARAALAVENANLLAALQEADRRKDEFLAILAHELRNPLAPIRNAVQILRTQGPPVPQLQWARDVIERQVEQLTRLVDDLLDVSRITRGKIELRTERVELAAVVRDAVEASRPLVEKWSHALAVELPPAPLFLQADRTRIAQVLLNLLDNAAKYTEPGGRIWLTAAREGGEVVIRVRDTGIGIPADMLARIFDLFTQVDRSVERFQGGLGIGLTLVQRLVAMHGGTVEARSAGPGQGSEFVLRLPRAGAGAPGARPATAGPEAVTAADRYRILVVDDNHDAAESLAMLLGMLGHDVRSAHDGLAAVETAEAFQPRVVLLDIGLPGLNGHDVARRIREQRGDDVVLVALTGWGQEEDRRRSREAGFDHHLTKPVEFGALTKLLADLGRDDRFRLHP